MLKKKFSSAVQMSLDAITTNHSKYFLSKHPANYFENKEKIVEKNLQILSNRFNLYPNLILHIKTSNPGLFIDQKVKLPLEKLHQFLTNELKLEESEIRFCLGNFPQIIEFEAEFYNERLKELQNLLGWSKEQSLFVLKNVPKVFFRPIKELEQHTKLFLNLFEKSQETISQFLFSNPFILLIEIDKVKRNNYLLFKFGLNISQIFKVCTENPSFMFQNPGNVVFILNHLVRLKLTKKGIASAISRNPFILTLNYPKMFVPQVKFWQSLGFDEDSLIKIFETYPFLISKSIQNTKDKLIYINRHFGINPHESSLALKLLCFKLKGFLIPRGTILLKKGIKDWKEYIDMNDQEFCKSFDISMEEYKKSVDYEKEGTHLEFEGLNDISLAMKKNLFRSKHF